MKRFVILAVCMACWLGLPRAQTTEGAEKELRDLEAKRFQALVKGDVVTLERILADDLIYTHSNGVRQGKFDVIGVLSNDFRYESINSYDVRVRIYNDTAIVAGRAAIKLKARGEQESFEICYLDVYARLDGRWQMVAWQSSRLPTPRSDGGEISPATHP